MKSVLLSTVLLFSLSCIADPISIQLPDKLHGKVKTVKRDELGYSSGDTSELKKVLFQNNWYWVDSFDKLGNKVLSYEVRDRKISAVIRYKYKIDNKGLITEIIRTYPKTNESDTTSYRYDSSGKVISENKYSSLTTYTYSAKSKTKRDSTWQSVTETIYRYDDSGNVIEEQIYTYGAAQYDITRYAYDSKGNIILRRREDSEHYEKYKYDSHNNLTLIEYCKTDEVYGRHFFEFDYDSVGNWIRCISDVSSDFLDESDILNNGPLYHVIIRQIEYY